MPEVHFEAGTLTAFQPPTPSLTHSVNPDHSAFSTTTLHAESRTTDPPYGRRPDWLDRVLFSACGQEIFIGGNPNHVAGAAAATREYAAATATSTPWPTSLCRPTRARPLAVPLHPHTTRLPQPRQRGLRLLPQWFRHARTHPHGFTSCANPPLLSHDNMIQTG